MPLATIPQAVADLQAGRFVIVVDDEGRENEGDLIVAAEKVTPAAINFMATNARGLICMPLTGERLDQLGIPMMVERNTSRHATAFTVSVEAKHGTTTGISAHDRAATVRALIDPATRHEDLVMPGHMFPLRAREGGVLVRAGHTEATIDLARMAGLYRAGVLCEIMNADGTMARLPQLEAFAALHQVNIISIADLIAYRRHHEHLVQRVAEARLPTRYGEFRAVAYTSPYQTGEHIALVIGDISGPEPVLVRVHDECLTGDVFGSLRCDCGDQVQMALERIAAAGRGVFLYMRQEGRGIGLHNKIRAYRLQEQGMDTVEANEALGLADDLREYSVGAQIMADMGLTKIRILTNNPKKLAGIQSYGLEVVEQVSILGPVNPHNRRYLETKFVKMGHLLDPNGDGKIDEADVTPGQSRSQKCQ